MGEITFDDVITRLPHPAKPTSKARDVVRAVQTKCPCHDDKKASLTISEKADGTLLFYCHADCDTDDILDALGLTYADISPNKKTPSCLDRLVYYYSTKYKWEDEQHKTHTGYGEGVHLVDEYRYTDEDGKYLYSKIRMEGGQIDGKLIRYYDVDRLADKAEPHKRSDDDHVLYRLRDFQKNKHKTKYVFYAEGEKDVETLRKHGLCATTAGSASDWRKEFAKYFKGLRVIVLRDNDNAGLKSAERIQSDLRSYAYAVKIVNPSELDHGDVTDYLTKEKGTYQSLMSLCESSGRWTYANYVNVDDNGNDKSINPGILAEVFAEHETYYQVRIPGEEKDQLRIYDHGVYKPLNKNGLKGLIKEYIPAAKRSDNMLNNVANLIMASNDKIRMMSDFNTDSRYINVENCLIDTITRKPTPHDPSVLSTIQLPIVYDPNNNRRDTFDSFMNALCTKADGRVDQDQMKLLQEIMGLLLSPLKVDTFKKAFILFGPRGNSGKSTFIRIPTMFFGLDHVASIKLNELKPDQRFILGTLPDCRLIVCGDESNSTINDSSVFKSLSGGDPVKIEAKGKQGYSFFYHGFILIGCNGLPCFADDKGDHLYDRLLIIPCDHHITEAERDPHIDEKLNDELPAIFNWALEGLYRLLDNGNLFTRSEACNVTKEEYHKAMDNVYRFICTEYEITGDYNDRISKSDFDDAYYNWTRLDSTIKAVEKKNLKARMEALGVITDSGNVGDRHHITVYRGIRRIGQTEDYPEDYDQIPF